jgi:hypothetical protein
VEKNTKCTVYNFYKKRFHNILNSFILFKGDRYKLINRNTSLPIEYKARRPYSIHSQEGYDGSYIAHLINDKKQL